MERLSPVLISIDDRLVGRGTGFFALALANSRASSASIFEISGTSSWLLNNAWDLNSKESCSSRILLNVCSSNILYDNRLAVLLKIGWRRCETSRTLSSLGLSNRCKMWRKYRSGTWKQSIWHHFPIKKWTEPC